MQKDAGSGKKVKLYFAGIADGENTKEFKQSKSNSSFRNNPSGSLKKNGSYDKIVERLARLHISSAGVEDSTQHALITSAKEIMHSPHLKLKPRSSAAGHTGLILSPVKPRAALFSHTPAPPPSAHKDKLKKDPFLAKVMSQEHTSFLRKNDSSSTQPGLQVVRPEKLGILKNNSDLAGHPAGTARSTAKPLEALMTELGFAATQGNRSSHTIMDPSALKNEKKTSTLQTKFNQKIEDRRKLKGSTSQKSPNFNITSPHLSLGVFPSPQPSTNSPFCLGSMPKKSGVGYHTASTLQTSSITSSEVLYPCKLTEESKLAMIHSSEYFIDNEVVLIAGLVTDALLSEINVESIVEDDTQRETPKILKGYHVHERSEQKFFMPKMSMITITTCRGIEPPYMRIIGEMEEESNDLRTPSFTHLNSEGMGVGSGEFTFGRESHEEPTKSFESDIPEIKNNLPKQVLSHRDQPIRVQSHNCSIIEPSPRQLSLPPREDSDVPDSQDSERFNLYKHIAPSDTDEGYIDSHSELGNSVDMSGKFKLYSKAEEIYEIDSNQFFLDDELRSKYQSVLQNN
jgi:hypothetical protein